MSRLSWPYQAAWVSFILEQGNTRRGSKQDQRDLVGLWKDPLTLPADVWEETADPEGQDGVDPLTGWGLVQCREARVNGDRVAVAGEGTDAA